MSDKPPKDKPSGEGWGTRIGVIMAVAGSAVGLGNFLRFPGKAAANGGGAFMIPYFVALLVIGIPLCWAEWSMGRYAGLRGFNSAPGIYGSIRRGPHAAIFGALALMIPLVIYMYYVIIEAWCLNYAIAYLRGSLNLGTDPANYTAYFNDMAGTQGNGFALSPAQAQYLGLLAFAFGVNFFLIYRGVSKGIEILCKYAMPTMAVCAVCVLVRVMTLESPPGAAPDQSVLGGLGFMWNPDFHALLKAETWLVAAGQIFFSLSVGFGVIINYASYLKEKDDVALSSLTACSMNEFFEVCLGGLITIPAAFIFLGAAVGKESTFSLGFNSLPLVFASMPGGQIFGFLWFFMLFLAAITSSVSMLQPVLAFLEEGLGMKRTAAVTALGLVSLAGCLFTVHYSAGLTALDTIDFWASTVGIFMLAVYQTILYGWVFGIERGHEELHRGAQMQVPWLVQIMLKYVSPVFLLAIVVGVCRTEVPKYVAAIGGNSVVQASIGLVVGVYLLLLVLSFIAERRWAAAGKFAQKP